MTCHVRVTGTIHTPISLCLNGEDKEFDLEADYIFHPGSPGLRDSFGASIEPDEYATADIVAVRMNIGTVEKPKWIGIVAWLSDDQLDYLSELAIAEYT